MNVIDFHKRNQGIYILAMRVLGFEEGICTMEFVFIALFT
jgi:hypothetical protein